MTLADLIADTKDRIAEGSSTFFTDATIKRWLNEAQRYVVRRTKIIERTGQADTVPGVSLYALEKDFWTLHFVKFNDDTLRPITINELEKRTSVKGTPSHYAVWGDGLHLYPAPSYVGTLTILYYAWPVEMENGTDEPEIPEAFHGLLPTFAAYRAKIADQQPAEANAFFVEFQQGLEELIAAYTDRQDQVSRVRDVSDLGEFPWL